jgi:hypothetical protein
MIHLLYQRMSVKFQFHKSLSVGEHSDLHPGEGPGTNPAEIG